MIPSGLASASAALTARNGWRPVRDSGIVAAGAATGQQGNEGRILHRVFFHSVALASLAGNAVLFLACAVPWIVPAAGKWLPVKRSRCRC